MSIVRKAMFRYKEKDSILNEIAKNIVVVTQNKIVADEVLREAFSKGHAISISRDEFDDFLKMSLKGAGFVRTKDKMNILSDKVINELVDSGYRIGVTSNSILLSRGTNE